MKIALVGPGIMSIPPSGWGAVESLIWDYYQELTNLGISVDIINISDRNDIINRLNNKSYDFIHIHYDVFYDIIPKLKCKNIAITSHYPYIGQMDRYSNDGYTSIFNFLSNNSSFWLFTLSVKDKFCFLSNGAREDRIIMCENGVSENFDFNPKCEYQDKSIYLGKIEPRKRQYLVKDIKSIDFVGPYTDFNLISLENYKGEMKRIDLYKNLTKYANLILLSQGESDPLVIKEAMMSGLGIVISESSSHMIDRNEDFIDIIPEERINDKNYIQVVIEENRRKSVLRREYIREYTLKKYSWKILVKKYIENIQKILY